MIMGMPQVVNPAPVDAGAGPGVEIAVDVEAVFTVSPMITQHLQVEFEASMTMTVDVTQGDAYLGGPGAGVGGSSPSKRLVPLLRRRR
jgi:hypothetical protein